MHVNAGSHSLSAFVLSFSHKKKTKTKYTKRHKNKLDFVMRNEKSHHYRSRRYAAYSLQRRNVDF